MNPSCTLAIQLNTKHCKACWKCLEACPKQVFGKIDFFFHKHAKIVKAKNCIGCLKCIKVCPHGALSAIAK